MSSRVCRAGVEDIDVRAQRHCISRVRESNRFAGLRKGGDPLMRLGVGGVTHYGREKRTYAMGKARRQVNGREPSDTLKGTNGETVSLRLDSKK